MDHRETASQTTYIRLKWKILSRNGRIESENQEKSKISTAYQQYFDAPYLPLYSPVLNSDDYLNCGLCRAVHQDLPLRDADDLCSAAMRQRRVIQRSGKHVYRYFMARSIRYAD